MHVHFSCQRDTLRNIMILIVEFRYKTPGKPHCSCNMGKCPTKCWGHDHGGLRPAIYAYWLRLLA